MINIFEVFLPQLLRYPNPNDPLNGEAAALLMRHPKEYETKVKGKRIVMISTVRWSKNPANRVCPTVRHERGCGRSGRQGRGRRRRRDERDRQHKRR